MSVKTNLAKVRRYFKKNGIVNTLYATVERVFFAYYKQYTYEGVSEEKLKEQRNTEFHNRVLVSIVVPTYETKEEHLREMIESVLSQTYSDFELILADASNTKTVEEITNTYKDARIVYHKLANNAGISENTNEGIKIAKGSYIALLDHDDLLTEDALFEIVKKIEEEKNAGKIAKIIFSDEDKCNGDGSRFFEPHYKPGYNRRLLFTNNYICHFLVCRAELMKELLLRKEFDGAQDFDFVLRATNFVEKEIKEGSNVSVCHVPKILYHWRCHENSTAVNPESKMYAYEAGKRAVQAAYDATDQKLQAEHSKHLGFYLPKEKNVYTLLETNETIGCVGGAVYKRNKIIGGAMDKQGNVVYKGLHKKFEGYMNRAHLMQNAYAVDVRNMAVCSKLQEELDLVRKTLTGADNQEYIRVSLEFCDKIRSMGYEIVYWEP